MAEKKVELNLGKIPLTPTVQGGGRFSTVIPKPPKTNSAIRLSNNLANFSTILGQYSNIQIKRGEQKAAAMDSEAVIKAMESQQEISGVPLTERIGFQRGYAEGLYSRYLQLKTIPQLNKLSLDLANLNADEIQAKDITEFDSFIDSKIKAVEDQTLQYVGDNPFQRMIHGAVFEPVKAEFKMKERAKFAKKQNDWSAYREKEEVGNGLYDILNYEEGYQADQALKPEDERVPLTEIQLEKAIAGRVTRLFQNYQKRSDSLNISPIEKAKVFQEELPRAISNFVNDPSNTQANKFEIAKQLVESIKKTRLGKFDVYNSSSGRTSVVKSLQIIEQAEEAFANKNEKFTAEIVKSNPKFIEAQALADNIFYGRERVKPEEIEYHGESYENADNAIDLLQDLILKGDMFEDGREQLVATSLLQERLEEFDRRMENEESNLRTVTNIGGAYNTRFDASTYVREIYSVEGDGEEAKVTVPLAFQDVAVAGDFGVSKGSVQMAIGPALNIAKKEADLYYQEILGAKYNEQLKDLIGNRSLTEEEKEKQAGEIKRQLLDEADIALKKEIKEAFRANFATNDKIVSLEEQDIEKVKEVQKSQSVTSEQARALVEQEKRQLAEGEIFGQDQKGNLVIKNTESFKASRRTGSVARTMSQKQFRERFENTREAKLFLNKYNKIDEVFEIFREYREQNNDQLYQLDSVYKRGNTDASRINAGLQILDIIEQNGGISEKEAKEQKLIFSKTTQKRGTRSRSTPSKSTSKTFQVDHQISQKTLAGRINRIPMLRWNTIENYEKQDSAAKKIVEEIATGLNVNADEFVKAQRTVYEQASRPQIQVEEEEAE